MSLLTAYFHGVVTNVLGTWLGHWVAPQPLHCHCSGPPVESGLIELPQSQLNRCGPADPAPVCPVCPPAFVGYGTGDVLLAGLVGLLIGALAGALVVGCVLPRRRQTAPALAVADAGRISTPGLSVSPISVSSKAILVRPGKGKNGVIVQG